MNNNIKIKKVLESMGASDIIVDRYEVHFTFNGQTICIQSDVSYGCSFLTLDIHDYLPSDARSKADSYDFGGSDF